MNKQLFHIFRNTPLGRETFLQSLYFCNMTGVTPVVYIPEHTKFLMYFENDVVQVDLDDSPFPNGFSGITRKRCVSAEITQDQHIKWLHVTLPACRLAPDVEFQFHVIYLKWAMM